MQPDTYRMLANRQDHYWWHRARRKLAISLLRRHDVRLDGTWVELGCGPGGNLGISEPFRPKLTVGIDLSPLAIDLARIRTHAALLQADLNVTLPFSNASCDVVTIFNVLYHQWVNDEGVVLSEVKRVLRPQGLLLVTEPAFPVLRREMDTAAMTRRRYRQSDLIAFCRKAGLEVLFTSYFTSFGFPLLAGIKAAQKFRQSLGYRRRTAQAPSLDMRPLNHVINEMMYVLAMIETRAIISGLFVPFGTTMVCLARKRS